MILSCILSCQTRGTMVNAFLLTSAKTFLKYIRFSDRKPPKSHGASVRVSSFTAYLQRRRVYTCFCPRYSWQSFRINAVLSKINKVLILLANKKNGEIIVKFFNIQISKPVVYTSAYALLFIISKYTDIAYHINFRFNCFSSYQILGSHWYRV
jgi:hypothetical protein